MISKPTNLSTGPVGITRQVQKALQEHPLSHRSTAFRNLYDQTTAFLSYSFNVRDTYLLTGSGTLANEVMLQEIKCMEGKGLILSNGEFGNRLIAQAQRNGLDFLTYKLEWGTDFNLATIEKLLSDHALRYHLQVGVYAAAIQEQLGGFVPDTYIYYIRYGQYVRVETAEWTHALNELEATIGSLLTE